MISFSGRSKETPPINKLSSQLEVPANFGASVSTKSTEFVPSTLVRETRADGIYTFLENPISGKRRIVTYTRLT